MIASDEILVTIEAEGAATRRREMPVRERANPPEAGSPAAGPAGPSPPSPAPEAAAEAVVAARTVAIEPGWFLIRPAHAPEAATQTVEISVVWSCPSPRIEQVSSAPETDAFLIGRSASCAAEKRAS
jgi:hypothetical protein